MNTFISSCRLLLFLSGNLKKKLLKHQLQSRHTIIKQLTSHTWLLVTKGQWHLQTGLPRPWRKEEKELERRDFKSRTRGTAVV